MGNKMMLPSESYYERVNKLILQLKSNIILKKTPLGSIFYKPTSYKKGNIVPDIKEEGWTIFQEDSLWGGTPDFHAWFYTHVALDKGFVGKTVRFQFNTDYCGWAFENPQFLVYINGKVVQGIDLNHRYFEIKKIENYVESGQARYAIKYGALGIRSTVVNHWLGRKYLQGQYGCSDRVGLDHCRDSVPLGSRIVYL